MNKINYYLYFVWLLVTYPFRKKYKANICGHYTRRSGRVMARNESCLTDMPLVGNGNPDYCLECIGLMSIQCAWCGKPIFIGDPVTLNIFDKNEDIPKYAVKYIEDERFLIGCLRFSCPNSIADRQGFWIPPGIVDRIPSPAEILMARGNEDEMIVVDDLGDPSDLGRIVKVGREGGFRKAG